MNKAPETGTETPLEAPRMAQDARQPMQSPEIGKLAEALARAQKAMEPLEKNKKATIEGKAKSSGREYKYSYEYADLPAVIEHLKDALSDNGLSYVQPLRVSVAGKLSLHTILMHTSGQWIASEWPMKASEDPKETAAFLTYGRRYCLTALCGVSAEETDDDADHGRTAEKVKGGLGVSALKKKLRAFVEDLRACEDEGMLAGLLESNAAILKQCQADLYREWWVSDSANDVVGLKEQIEVKRMELERKAQEEPNAMML